MNSSLTVILFFCLMGVCFGVKYKDCGSKEGVLKAVTCTDDASGECQLKRGTNASLEIDFTSKTTQRELNNSVHTIFEGVPWPFSTGDSNACDGIEEKCPIVPKKDYHFKAYLPVKSFYPRVHVVIKWEIQDSKGNDVICVLFPVAIIA